MHLITSGVSTGLSAHDFLADAMMLYASFSVTVLNLSNGLLNAGIGGPVTGVQK